MILGPGKSIGARVTSDTITAERVSLSKLVTTKTKHNKDNSQASSISEKPLPVTETTQYHTGKSLTDLRAYSLLQVSSSV